MQSPQLPVLYQDDYFAISRYMKSFYFQNNPQKTLISGFLTPDPSIAAAAASCPETQWAADEKRRARTQSSPGGRRRRGPGRTWRQQLQHPKVAIAPMAADPSSTKLVVVAVLQLCLLGITAAAICFGSRESEDQKTGSQLCSNLWRLSFFLLRLIFLFLKLINIIE